MKKALRRGETRKRKSVEDDGRQTKQSKEGSDDALITAIADLLNDGTDVEATSYRVARILKSI